MAHDNYDMLGWLESLAADEDGQTGMLTVEIPTSACDVGAETVTVPAGALIEALIGAMTAAADGWDGCDDAEPPETVHVSPRNNDPAYREAKAMNAALCARELLEQVETDENVAAFPVTHRDDMPEDYRALHAKAGETFEAYAGRQGGVYTVHTPAVSELERRQLEALGLTDPLDQKLFLLYAAFLPNPPAAIDGLLDLLSLIRSDLPDAAADAFREIVALGTESTTLGQITDADAWLVQWELPDRLVVAVVQ